MLELLPAAAGVGRVSLNVHVFSFEVRVEPNAMVLRDVVVTVSRVARRTEPQHGLGAALKELRLERGLSQEELAHRASLHPTWISHLESGRENPALGGSPATRRRT